MNNCKQKCCPGSIIRYAHLADLYKWAREQCQAMEEEMILVADELFKKVKE